MRGCSSAAGRELVHRLAVDGGSTNFAFGDYKLNGASCRMSAGRSRRTCTRSGSSSLTWRSRSPHATTVVNGVVEDMQVNDVTGNRRTITGNFLGNVRTGGSLGGEPGTPLAGRTFYYAFDVTASRSHGNVTVCTRRRRRVSSDFAPHVHQQRGVARSRPERCAFVVQAKRLCRHDCSEQRTIAAVVAGRRRQRRGRPFLRVSAGPSYCGTSRRETLTRLHSRTQAAERAVIALERPLRLDGVLSHDHGRVVLTAEWTLGHQAGR